MLHFLSRWFRPTPPPAAVPHIFIELTDYIFYLRVNGRVKSHYVHVEHELFPGTQTAHIHVHGAAYATTDRTGPPIFKLKEENYAHNIDWPLPQMYRQSLEDLIGKVNAIKNSHYGTQCQADTTHTPRNLPGDGSPVGQGTKASLSDLPAPG